MTSPGDLLSVTPSGSGFPVIVALLLLFPYPSDQLPR